MADSSSKWNKAFIAFGVLTVLSGIALIVQSQYIIGIPGTIIGVWLIVQNLQKREGDNQN
ncbi:MAG: hypothetical protein AAFP02_17345 [Bacteroidota bacterium]